MKILRLLVFLAVVIVIINLSYFYPRLTGKGFYKPETVVVTEVLDGDTFKTEEGSVRLLCINAPEKNKQYYQESKEFLKEFENKEVYVLRDKTDRDKYSRRLRFVFYKDMFITKELVEEGLAHLYLCEGTKYYS